MLTPTSLVAAFARPRAVIRRGGGLAELIVALTHKKSWSWARFNPDLTHPGLLRSNHR